jgi:hypothetical protein
MHMSRKWVDMDIPISFKKVWAGTQPMAHEATAATTQLGELMMELMVWSTSLQYLYNMIRSEIRPLCLESQRKQDVPPRSRDVYIYPQAVKCYSWDSNPLPMGHGTMVATTWLKLRI